MERRPSLGTRPSDSAVGVRAGASDTPMRSLRTKCGCTGSDLDVSFTDTSSAPDGTVVTWSWDFGDGSYDVTLTVTDNQGLTDAITTRSLRP